MKTTTLLLVAVLALLAGCARFSTTQTDVSNDNLDGSTTRTITTKASASTFFAAKSALAQWKATQTDKTQGASVGSLTQESGGTNVTQLIEAVVGAAVKAAVKGVAP
jgi:hypothetical protein